MAVSIDKVYQKVLALANKEQRGYITPQEFNIFADLAQMEIFEQYFYDLDQYMRSDGSAEEYSDIVHNIQEKIAFFEVQQSIHPSGTLPPDSFYRLGTVIYNHVTEVEEVQQNEILYINKSLLIKPSTRKPVYVRTSATIITPYPSSISSNLSCTYTRKPNKPSWGYVVVNTRAMYDADITTDFELHPAEESELVYKILKFAGLAIKRDDLAKGGQGLESLQVQQEKQ